jgi:hypothetical protein
MTHHRIIEATRTHSDLIPLLFPHCATLKSVAALYLAIDPPQPAQPLSAGILAAPGPNEDRAYLCDIMLLGRGERYDSAGSDLLSHIIEVSTCLLAPEISLLKPVSDPALRRLWQQQGFTLNLHSDWYHFSIQAAHEVLNRKLLRLFAAGAVPEKTEFWHYGAKLDHTLSELCVREFGLMTLGHLRALDEYDSMDSDFSCSLMLTHHQQLVGAIGVGHKNGLAEFDPLLIAPRYRNAWAFPLLLNKVAECLLEKNVDSGKALIRASSKKIRHFMDRVGADRTGFEQHYSKKLSIPEGRET